MGSCAAGAADAVGVDVGVALSLAVVVAGFALRGFCAAVGGLIVYFVVMRVCEGVRCQYLYVFTNGWMVCFGEKQKREGMRTLEGRA